MKRKWLGANISVFVVLGWGCGSEGDGSGGAGATGSGGKPDGSAGSAGLAGSSGKGGSSGSGGSGTDAAQGSGGTTGTLDCAPHGKIGEDCLNNEQCSAGQRCLSDPGICLPESALPTVGCSLQPCPQSAECVGFDGISYMGCLTPDEIECACRTTNGKAELLACSS